VTARNNISTKGVNLGTNAAVSNNLAAADSLFAAPATANYRLSTSGRGAIDAGTSVGPLDDARADGPDADATAQPDIGAFEYGARAWTAGSTKLAAPKAVVTGLTVAAPSAGRRDLRWTDISGETGYVVQRSSTNGSFWEEAVRLPANTTSYADVGLKGGKYLYRVRGLSDALAAYSRPASASARVAGTTFPASSFDATGGGSAPLTVFGDNIGNSSPNAYARYNNVDFGAAGSITRFYATIATGSGGNHIYVRLDNPTTGTTIADLTTASTGGFGTYNEQSAGVSAAARGVRDVYIVFSNWGTANMNSFRFTPTAPLAINAPAQVGGLTARAASSTQVNLSWTDLSGESNYKVERSTDNLFWAHIGHTAAGVTTYSDTGRTASTKYYYRVLAVNAAGDSQRSYSANATTPSATVTGAFSGSQTAASAAKLDTGDSTVGYPLGYRILTSDTDADWNSQKAIKTGAGSSAITEIDLLT
jgi:titin